MQKLEMSNPKYSLYKNFEDSYDNYFKALKEVYYFFEIFFKYSRLLFNLIEISIIC